MLDLAGVKLDLQKLYAGCWWELELVNGRLEGKPVEEPGADQPALLIVPMSGSYQTALDAEQVPYAEELRREDLADERRGELEARIHGRVIARKVLRGWQNIANNGEALEWTEEAAETLLTDPAWRMVLEFCMQAATQREAALAREEAAAAGN